MSDLLADASHGAVLLATFEAIGTCAAPGIIFWVGYRLGEWRERRAARMKVLIEANAHARRLHIVCSQLRSAGTHYQSLSRNPSITFAEEAPREPEQIRDELRDTRVRLLNLVDRRAELSVVLDGDWMLVEVAFDKAAAELIAAIKRVVMSASANDEDTVRTALGDVTGEIRLLAHAVLGHRVSR